MVAINLPDAIGDRGIVKNFTANHHVELSATDQSSRASDKLDGNIDDRHSAVESHRFYCSGAGGDVINGDGTTIFSNGREVAGYVVPFNSQELVGLLGFFNQKDAAQSVKI